jgi:catechol 2,3-dioxygenase-like lactoylglutathione lyase family enzyme
VGAPPPDLTAFHIGLVVRDLDSVASRYQKVLGVDHWRVFELNLDAIPWNARSTKARVRIAYGQVPGQTIELVEVLEGWTQQSDWLEAHGEGVNHIGFWTPDVRASVDAAIAAGGRVVSALIDQQNNAVVQLKAGAANEAIIRAIDRGGAAYADPGLGAVQFEFIGPGIPLHEYLKEDYAWLNPPPWSRAARET